jgi:hypothetical protein
MILFWKRRPCRLKGMYFELAIRDAEQAGFIQRRADYAGLIF